MENIREDFLHYLWENRLYNPNSLIINGQAVEVIEPGLHNSASGPDFFNARIRIGETLWAGNVEIHVKSSDWFLHKHQGDPAYLNVILHVVFIQDCRLERPGGEEIPCLTMKFDSQYLDKFNALVKGNEIIACREFLHGFDKIYWSDWLSKLMIGRLEDKAGEVNNFLSTNKYNWEDTLYHFLGRSFGFKINGYPFENLVRSTPLNILQKYRENPLTINALLFGQAGFLEDLIAEDAYYLALQREYHSLSRILPARVLDKFNWKFMGARPGNFPLVRIAQFASLIVNKYPLFARIIDHPDLNSWRKVFETGCENYWETHYLFGKVGRRRKIRMGRMAADLLILNAFVPLIFHYGSFRRRPELKDKVLAILCELPPEKNKLTESWNKCGIKAANAFESQALIHLTTHYCKRKRCLECMIGNRVIKQ